MTLKQYFLRSPHITTLHERISINGAPIPPSAFDDLISRHKHTIESEQQKQQGRLSHFEILTALAFKHFQEENVDIAVVETGLGGVRDATNVLSDNTLKAAVVTAVGMDHAAALGGSMESIARAKAGIFKSGKPAIMAAQPHKEAYQVVHTQGSLILRKSNSILFHLSRNYCIQSVYLLTLFLVYSRTKNNMQRWI